MTGERTRGEMTNIPAPTSEASSTVFAYISARQILHELIERILMTTTNALTFPVTEGGLLTVNL